MLSVDRTLLHHINSICHCLSIHMYYPILRYSQMIYHYMQLFETCRGIHSCLRIGNAIIIYCDAHKAHKHILPKL